MAQGETASAVHPWQHEFNPWNPRLAEEKRQLHIQSSTFRARPCLKGIESDGETHTDLHTRTDTYMTHRHYTHTLVCVHTYTHFVYPVGKTMFLITVLVCVFWVTNEIFFFFHFAAIPMAIHLIYIFHYFFFICVHLGYQILVKIYNVNFVFLFFEREFCVAQDGFKLATQSRLALNFWFSLFLPPKCWEYRHSPPSPALNILF